MRPTLIPEWRQAWRMASVVIAGFGALGSAVAAAWAFLSPELRDLLPPWVAPLVASVVFLGTIAGRLAAQPKLRADTDGVAQKSP